MKPRQVFRHIPLLLAAGCNAQLPKLDAPNPGAPGSAMVDRIAGEAARLGALLRLDVLLQFVILVVVAVFLTRFATAMVRFAWRLGIDSERRLGWWEGGSRVLVGALVIYFVVRSVAQAAPMLSAFGLLALLIAGSRVFSAHLQNLTSGVALLLRRKVRHGDRIQVGSLDGIIESVGITQLRLTRADGSTVLVPNRLLNEEALTVAREKNSVPVRVRLRFEAEPSRAMLELARRAALLSPYRAPGSSVEVVRDASDSSVLEVAVQVWAATAVRAATDHLEGSLRLAMPQDAGSANGKDAAGATR